MLRQIRIKEARASTGFLRVVFWVPEIISIPSFHGVERRDDPRRRFNFLYGCSTSRTRVLDIPLSMEFSPPSCFFLPLKPVLLVHLIPRSLLHPLYLIHLPIPKLAFDRRQRTDSPIEVPRILRLHPLGGASDKDSEDLNSPIKSSPPPPISLIPKNSSKQLRTFELGASRIYR